jgi:hypothetical protein
MLRTWRFWDGGHRKLRPAGWRRAARGRRRKALRSRMLGVESLEDRYMLAANPVLSIEPGQFFEALPVNTAGEDNQTPFRATFTDEFEFGQSFSYTIDWGDNSSFDPGQPVSVTNETPLGLLGLPAIGDPLSGRIEAFHSYTAAGHYTVEVQLYDGISQDPVATQTAGVDVYPSDANLNISGDPFVNEGGIYTLNLDGTGSGVPNIDSWVINWGDEIQEIAGNPSTVTHVYADDDDMNPGFQTPHFLITAAAHGSNIWHFGDGGNSVEVQDVVGTVELSGPSQIGEGAIYTLNFNWTEPDPGDAFLGWVIAWGDEGPIDFTREGLEPLLIEGNPPSATHVYANGDATYTILAIPIIDDAINMVPLDGSLSVTVNSGVNIDGEVYVDVNHNGIFEANEPGIGGVTIKLLDQNGNAVLDEFNSPITAVTNSGGYYLFEGGITSCRRCSRRALPMDRNILARLAARLSLMTRCN